MKEIFLFDSIRHELTSLRDLKRQQKMFVVVAADACLLFPAVWAAYCLRLSNFGLPPTNLWPLFMIAPLLSLFFAAILNVYSASTRFFSWHLESRIIVAQLLVMPVWGLTVLLLGPNGFPRSILIIYAMLAIFLMTLLRRLAGLLLQLPQTKFSPIQPRTAVVIYGTGREALQLAESLRRQGKYRPVAFMDTDQTIIDRIIGGLKVYDAIDLQNVTTKTRVTEVIIAKPNMTRTSRLILVNHCLEAGLLVKIMPDYNDILDGKVDISDLRPIKLEDLLGRDPVPPDRKLMDKALKGRVVLVTGAGGSIGSELVRQAAEFGTSKLILVDVSEFALFEIHREIESQYSKKNRPFELHAILADVKDCAKMESIMRYHKVEVVFHAAAYKHVRLVQENPSAGILNNVWGTKATAEAAIAAGVKLFIFVSTDKAVRPTSIMGASKRVAEMVIQALAAKPGRKPVFSMVRFGNVLGSTGSVVPLFQEQINKGGPVTVTHPDVTRYFMLIPEAAQLVVQAGAMAEGGEVFVLDMGQSVKILHLAETMIELAGLSVRSKQNPDGDIEIQFVGLKDGEKLFEELQIGNDISPTKHPRIMRSREFMLKNRQLSEALEQLATGPSEVELLHKLAGLGS